MRTAAVFVVVTMLAMVAFGGREVAINATYIVDSGYLKIQKAYGIIYSDLTNSANPGAAGVTQTATTNPVALSMGSVTTPGWSFFRNLSEAVVVQVGPTGTAGVFMPTINLNTGEVAMLNMALPKANIFVAVPASYGTNKATLEYTIVDK